MRAAAARPHARGIDTVQALDAAACRHLVRAGVDFVVRYLHGRYAVTREEVARILCSGLALMLCTPSRTPGWTPSGDIGATDGQMALDWLADLSIPKGATVWLDLEGCMGPADKTAEWINAWSMLVVGAGYQAGLYVGADPGGLDSEALWKLPRITRYWRSGSRVPEPSNRGWCMQQLRPLDVMLGPIRVDHDAIETDFRGGLPTWIEAT
jgi:hypothetical protein